MRRDVDRDRVGAAHLGAAGATPASALLALLARPLVGALLQTGGTRSTGSRPSTSAQLLVVFAPQVPLYGIGVVLTGVLQAQRTLRLAGGGSARSTAWSW